MKKGKMASSDRIALPNKTTIKGPEDGDSYEYLEVIQGYGTKHHKTKEKVKIDK